MPNNDTNADDRLFEELKAALEAADPIPDDVIAAAKAGFTWRTVDAELAELAFDSALEGVAGVRGPATERRLTFRTPHVQIELTVHTAGELRHVVGQLVPAQTASVELRVEAARHQVDVDASGSFEFEDVPSGPVSVRCVLGDGTTITTEWTAV